jgi:cell wall-associated NlpC family hydrolase
MKLPKTMGAAFLIGVLIGLMTSVSGPAQAAQSLQTIQGQITRLQEEAATAAEGAQAAKVQLASLTRTLTGIRQEANAQGQTVTQLRKSLGAIAVEQYKSGGLSQGLELLFSSDPTLYLSAAGSLESLTRRKAIQLSAFATAQQRLNATTLTVHDKMTLVRVTQNRLAVQSAQAQAKLQQAQRIFGQLKKSDRIRLTKLTQHANDKVQASSLSFAKEARGLSGRGGIALKFALNQIGDWYVFGAAGVTYWDCSGLTLRAYQAAGVSLPHSAAAQSNYGRSVSFNDLRPGDLVFFGSPISHVSIYLGGGRMVDAPHPGARVRVESFSGMWGNLRLVAARRF